MDAQRDQENLKEPGPWNKPHKKGKLFSKSKVCNELGFEIHEDIDISEVDIERPHGMAPIRMNPLQSKYDKPINLPPRFCARNRPQSDWIIPVTTEETRDRNCISEYQKCQAYPRPNMEFQPEEYKAYVAFLKRNIANRFTQKRDVYWGRGPFYNLRMYPHFAKQSNPQKLNELDSLFMPPKVPGMQLPFDDIYNEEEQIERQYEEILSLRIKRNETIIKITDMEETVCVSSERVQRRKSFYPMRRSMAPCANPNRGGAGGSSRKMSIMSGCIEEHEEKNHEITNQSTATPPIFEDRDTIATPKLLSKAKKDLNPETPLMRGEKDFEIPKIFKQQLVNTTTTLETNVTEPLISGQELEIPKLFKQKLPSPSQLMEKQNPEAFTEGKEQNNQKLVKQQLSRSTLLPRTLSPVQRQQNNEYLGGGKDPETPKVMTQQMSYEPSISIEENSQQKLMNNQSAQQLTEEKELEKSKVFRHQSLLDEPKETPQPITNLNELQYPELPTKEKRFEIPKAQSALDPMPSKELTKEISSKIPQPIKTPTNRNHFEIFQDESFVTKPKMIAAVPKDDNGFAFKTPALPVSTGIPTSGSMAPKPNKIHFEIFEDFTAGGNGAGGKTPGDINSGTGGYFDADESCSTQIFNIHLKAQSVSTPKTKPEPQRQFGTILKETMQPVGQPIFENKDEDVQSGLVPHIKSVTDANDENSPVAGGNAVFSPTHRKQLSTILETSENGTTQSTHNTGATTKSTISSPELEQEMYALNLASKSHVPTLGTLKERTLESSHPSASSESSIEEKLNSMKIANITQKEKNDGTPPGMIRSDVITKRNAGGGLDFSIFEDTVEKVPTNVGNFSRLEERQETATGFSVKPIKFQEDKTETITRMMLAPSQQPMKLQEDKTEHIPPMLLGPSSQHLQFQQEDKTETISKIILGPSPPPLQFQEDKTETISKILLAPPAPASPPPGPIIFEDTLPQVVIKDNSIFENKSKDDLFEFFSQSPRKYGKAVQQSSQVMSGQVRPAAENMTPTLRDSKRFCDIDTPNMHQNKSKVLLFPNVGGGSSKKPKSIFRDSFMPDFSMIEDNEPKKLTKPKSVLRDSFIPDFSLIENTQETAKQAANAINHSLLPDLTHIPETQDFPKKNDSFIPDSSQPAYSRQERSIINNLYGGGTEINSHKNSKENSLESMGGQTSFLPDFSCIPETQQLSQHLPQQHHQQMSKSNEGQPSGLKNILTDTFMKDFSDHHPRDVKEMSMLQPSKNNSTLKYLEETISHKSLSNSKTSDCRKSSISKNSLEDKNTKKPKEKFFELNAETEMFGTNVSMIKNSTMFYTPQRNQGAIRKTLTKQSKDFEIQEDSIYEMEREANKNTSQMIKNNKQEMEPSLLTIEPNNRNFENCDPNPQVYQIHEKSLHIKEEKYDKGYSILSSPSHFPNNDFFAVPKPLNSGDLPKPKLNFLEKSNYSNSMMSPSRFSIDVSQSELEAINNAKRQQQQMSGIQKSLTITQNENNDVDDDFGEMSIYYKNTPKTPKAQVHVWDDNECHNFKTPSDNRYTYAETDLNQTMQMLENVRMDPNVNPFSVDLINAFLEQIQFTNYIKNIPQCMLVGVVHRLKAASEIKVNAIGFKVTKLIGEGAYGAVFAGREVIGGKKVAMKQEKPPNLWEYYICLEIQDRLRIDEMLPAFMSVDYALIGNNCSILISQYSEYGSLIAVCNKIKKHTLKNVDEYVVMVLACELLEIMDHLHAICIIHADIKADNFLLMNKIKYPAKERSLQLIDFGVSIDMKLFRPNQTFSYVHSDNSFKCVEMREHLPWTYQLDLYGLAGVIHVLLFGKYMEIAKKPSGIWMHKTHVPRYFNRDLWETIFKALLNIRDCKSIPNLQGLRALLKEEIEEKEKYVTKMINEFNRALDM